MSTWKLESPGAAKEERREALGVIAYQHIDQEGIDLAHAWGVAPGSEAWVENMTELYKAMSSTPAGGGQSSSSPAPLAPAATPSPLRVASDGSEQSYMPNVDTTPTPRKAKGNKKSDSGDDYEDSDYETSDDDFEMAIKEEDQDENSDGRRFKGPYTSCEWCIKGFTRAAHARRHVRDQHHKTITNTCEGCGKAFYRKDNWQAHKRGCKSLKGKK